MEIITRRYTIRKGKGTEEKEMERKSMGNFTRLPALCRDYLIYKNYVYLYIFIIINCIYNN